MEEENDKLDEIIKDTGDNNPIPDETLDNSSSNNFETKVKKRNTEAKEAKEQLEQELEEEEPKKSIPFLKIGFGVAAALLIGKGLLGTLKAKKTVQNTQISQDEGISNENI